MGKCAFCGKPEAATSVEISPFGFPMLVSACAACVRPVWHAMGLLSWSEDVGLLDFLKKKLK